MHRRLWSNDPDCIMLRTDDTHLDAAAARAWAETVACSGGLVLASDDLTRLGREARALLEEVVDRGRAADAASLDGDPPRCVGLLDPAGPGGLEGPAGRTQVDLASGHGGLV
jgi:alpha-galactosidase